MTATFTWIVVQLNVQPSVDGETNVVFSVDWKCDAEQVENGTTYKSSETGNIGTPYNPADPFIPYANLTEEQVFAWCAESGLNQEFVQFTLQGNINNQINPPIITPPLPWTSNTTLPA